jgi:ribosomal protein S17
MTFFSSQYSKYPRTATAMMTENCEKMKMQNTVTIQKCKEYSRDSEFYEGKKSVTENLIVGSLSVYNNTCS